MKKVLSVLLTLVMLLVPVLGVTASAQEINYNKTCPCIDVPGFMTSTIYEDKTDPNSKRVFEWSTDEILALVKDALPALGKFMLTYNYDKLADEIIPLAKDFFATSVIDGDGTVQNGSGVIFTYPDRQTITADSTVTFRYDWRADPMLAAEELNDFIDYVLDASGCDQVTIQCHSLGGVVTLSYIAMYGDAKIKSICFNTTAIYGEIYTGELLSGQLVLNADAVVQFLKYVFDENEYEVLLNSLIKMLKNAGMLDFLCKFGNRLIEGLSPRVLTEVVAPLCAGWLSIWDMAPDEYVDAAKEYMFGYIYKDDPMDRSGLIERIDAYTNTVRKNRESILTALDEHANVYVISRYGYSSIPITPSYLSLGDGVIDTKLSSFGATCADYGSILTDAQKNGADARYISPEGNINALSCRFPEQTWFVRNFKHSENSGEFDRMIDRLLNNTTQATVDTFEEYPRYLLYNAAENGSITPYSVPEKEPGFFERVKIIFRSFFRLIKQLFTSLF